MELVVGSLDTLQLRHLCRQPLLLGLRRLQTIDGARGSRFGF